MKQSKPIEIKWMTADEIETFRNEKEEAEILFGYMFNPFPTNRETITKYGYVDNATGKTLIKYLSAIGLKEIRKCDCPAHVVNWKELYRREGYSPDEIIRKCAEEYLYRRNQKHFSKRWLHQDSNKYITTEYDVWSEKSALRKLGLEEAIRNKQSQNKTMQTEYDKSKNNSPTKPQNLIFTSMVKQNVG